MYNVDNLGLKRGYLSLEDYDEKYVNIFLKEKENLERILKDHYISIEHVGSTSIKNIKSKPIIDILVTCNNLEEFKKFIISNVINDTYTLKEDMIKPDDMLIRKEEDGKVKAFIHVVPYYSEHARNYILFRNFLNENTSEAKEYEKLKLQLFSEFKNDRKKYTAGKEEYIKSVIEKARKYYDKI